MIPDEILAVDQTPEVDQRLGESKNNDPVEINKEATLLNITAGANKDDISVLGTEALDGKLPKAEESPELINTPPKPDVDKE